MTSRAEVNQAWGEGYAAGQDGASRAANPYIGIDPEKAKAWDQGWQETSK